VVETPPNILGVIDDGWMRYITDLGNVGPDRGQGGSFLLVHDDFEGEVPDGHFVFRTPTYKNWVMARAFVGDTGEGESALRWYRENFRVYPLATGPDPDAAYPALRTPGDCTHARDVRYFERLAEIVQYEPSGAFTPYQLGPAQGDRHREGTTVRAGRADAGPAGRGHRDRRCDRQGERLRLPARRGPCLPGPPYEYLFLGGRHDFMSGDALWLDARLLFHYEAIVVTPAMAIEMVGAGSQYLACYRDANDDFLMGQHTYRLHLPPDIPAANFWSVTAYHPETRSLLATARTSRRATATTSCAGTTTARSTSTSAPTAPEGYEQNWIKTLPDQGWSILIRLYGPLEPYFDQTWKPDDIVRTD
jgi:hypothetical protein